MMHVHLTAMKRNILYVAAIVATTLYLIGCKSIYKLDSVWIPTPPRIDGSSYEWRDKKAYSNEYDIAVAAGNDSAFLYVYVATMDRMLQRQLLAGGLTVWFDDKAKKGSACGIRFPAAQAPVQPFRKREQEHDSSMPDKERINELNNRVELLGPEEGQMRIVHIIQANELGLAAGLGVENGEVAIELKLPLQPTDGTPCAVHSDISSNVCLRLEISPPKMSAGGRKGRGGPGGGMHGGGGGMHGGGMGGERPGNDPGRSASTRSEPLKIRLAIILAKE